MKKYLSICILVVLVSLLVLPNSASAAWWNPLSWFGIKISISRPSSISPIQTKDVEATSSQVPQQIIATTPKTEIIPKPTKSPTPATSLDTKNLKIDSVWSREGILCAESVIYFNKTIEPTADLSNWKKLGISLPPCNWYGDERFAQYHKANELITPQPTNITLSPPTIDQLKHLYAFCAQSLDMQNLCDKYDAVGQYYKSQVFRDAWNQVIAKYEATMAAQPKNNTPVYLHPPPSFNYNRPLITLGPVPTIQPLPQYTLAPTPKPQSISEQMYQERLCNSVGGYISFGECHDGISY